jgi:rRNA maturation RNase YbeY
MIKFYTDNIDFRFPYGFKKRCSLWMSKCIIDNGFSIGNINVILTSDETLLKTNIEFLQHDFYTDIITFNSNVEKRMNGELYISYDRVLENADGLGIPVIEELKRVIIHGIIHLLGYDDSTDDERAKMTEKENLFLKLF